MEETMVELQDYITLPDINRSGGGAVDNILDYHSRDHQIDPPLLRSFE